MPLNIIEDNPILNHSQDIFHRDRFAKLIADSIIAKTRSYHNCFTIGLYAKWGEGKTSVLNLIKSYLQKSDNVVISDFNPWMFKDSESLMMDFFNSIKGEDIKKFVEGLKKYAPIVSLGISKMIDLFAPPVHPRLSLGKKVDDSITTFIDRLPSMKENAVKRKENLNKEIKATGQHLVIFIDDIDRLDSEETHTVMKLIKQTADFDNTIFVVAMDKDVVAASLAGKFDNGNQQAGYDFLEKIIQVQFYLPKIQKRHLADYFDRKYRAFVDSLLFSPEEVQELIRPLDDIHRYVLPLFTSPREVIQYINILSFSIPPCLHEVDLSDLCLLEALKISAPGAYNHIRDNRYLFTVEWILDDGMEAAESSLQNVAAEEQEEAGSEEILSTIRDMAKPHIKNNITSLIKKLLQPYLEHARATHSVGDKRLCTPRYFDKYFLFDTPEEIMSEKDIDKLVTIVKKEVLDLLPKFFVSCIEKFGVDELYDVLYSLFYDVSKGKLVMDDIAKIVVSLSMLPENKERKYFTESNSSCWETKISQLLVPVGLFHPKESTSPTNTVLLEKVVKGIMEKADKRFGLYCLVTFYINHSRFKTAIPSLENKIYTQTKQFIAEYSHTEFFNLDGTCLSKICQCWKKENEEEYSAFIKQYDADKKCEV